MQAKDVMTQKVISVGPEDTILRAIRLMLQNKVSGLPVVDASGRLVGIVTEGDFLRRAETGTVNRPPRWIEFLMGVGPLAAEYAEANGRKVHEVMTSEVRSVTEDTSLEDVVNVMEKYHIKRVPVLREQTIVGIISRANIVRAVATAGRRATKSGSTVDDPQIRNQLLELLDKQRWAPTGTINVSVSNGVVTFTGAIFDDRQRDGLRVAAENIPGVKNVVDEMVWIDPASGYIGEPPVSQAS
ncbi:MAG TPA: CBS domain-containing protein [Xanthobacteraceae bacterium]|nr:CBS domain-containing protein [Xanthobacteraceae bacterium]